MKRILIALSLIFAVTALSAQPKSPEAAKQAIEKALNASMDAKKASKVATWLTLSKAYTDAYDYPSTNLIVGTARNDAKTLLGKQRIQATEEVNIGGLNYTVDRYEDKDLYYNPEGLLEFYLVTKPAVEGDLLGKAVEALAKGVEVDAKKSKADEIKIRMDGIHQKLGTEAYANYMVGNFAESAALFAKAAAVSEGSILNKKDDQNTYYAALMYGLGGNHPEAIKYYNKCIADGNYQEGNVFSNLSNIYLADKDTVMGKKVLEDGFAKYPQSQGVLVGLINLYRSTNEDPQKLFDLLHAAQKNEPGNASLYYVEGDIYKTLGDVENAEKYFRKATEIDPNYVYGILSVGVLYYDRAVEIQTAANDEMNDAKYNALMTEFEETLEKAVAPFEESFKMTEDAEIKSAVAEYLKNIYFRFRSRGDEYMEKYNFYNDYLKK